MNRFTRLTALLLALMMIFSTFAAAETSYQVGDMTTEQWNSIVQNAKDILNKPVIDEGDSGKVITPPTETPTPSAPYDKTIEVTLGQNKDITTANLAVVKSDVADQWQIAIKDDLWVNILGEDDSTLNVNAAMLQGTTMAVRQAADADKVTVFTVTEATAVQTFAVETRADSTGTTTGAASDVMTVEEANPDIEKFSLKIVYRTAKSVEVASPYTASFVNGSSYSATVRYPDVRGYTPQLSTSAIEGVTLTDNGDSLTYSFTKLTPNAPIEIVVLYNPAQVTYDVNHYQQNADDDDYKLVDTKTLDGYTEAETEAVAEQYDGFYALLFDQPTIAADGSTDVNIYYDRHYYLMNFELSGGYGVEPIYARYGETISSVGNPTRAGYTFVGWASSKENADAGRADTSVATAMPLNGITYYAVWNAGEMAKVSIVIWGENPNDEEYSLLDSREIYAKPGTSLTYPNDGSLICGLEEHTHGVDCGDYNCGIEEHTHSMEQGCYTLTCEETPHTHTDACNVSHCTHTACDLMCYSADYGTLVLCPEPDTSDLRPTFNGQNGVYSRTESYIFTYSYLYFDGQWYRIKVDLLGDSKVPWVDISHECAHVHTDACYGCGQVENDHEHTLADCYSLTCQKAVHIHTNECGYNCGKITHAHSANCYATAMDSALWKFVSADTVTVAADGSTVINVKYDRVEKTLAFHYNYDGENRKYNGNESITAKWGEDISAEYEAIVENAKTTFWSAKDSNSGPYTNYFGVMPKVSAHYYNRGAGGNAGTMYYYGQGLNDPYDPHTGYSVSLFTVPNVGGYTVTAEDRYEFEGFTCRADVGTQNGASCSNAKFYYSRNSYTLVFNDGYNDVKTDTVMYEMPLGSYDFTPTLPVDVNGNPVYPPNSVTFGGWYLNKECTGAEYKLSEHIMPAENVLLYAKWVPVDKTVTFYLDLPTLETNGAALGSVTVPYGTKVAEENIPAHEKTGYKFVGWFYVENGEEKAFDFANMPVTKDMEVYGKWTSDTMVPYRVRYVYVENDKETPVAADETGSAPGGSTETFDAKVGTELYDNYQKGYFPTLTKSHNVLMEVVKDANGVVQEVVYTFYYYKRDAVPYIVYYVDSEGKNLLDPYVNTGNVESIVSETFKPITGYMPDEFQKSLVVNGANDESVQWITVTVNGVSVQVHPDNVITFVYSKNETEALYVMSYYMEELDGSYTLYARENAQVGTVDQKYSNKPLETVPEGFSYEKTVVVTSADELVKETTEKQISAVLTTAGLEFKHYYKRNLYPYTVYYYKQGTTESVYASKTVSDNKYGQKVPETARDLTPAYSLVSLPEASITIGTGENVIIFEYAENDVLIQYEAVGLTEEQKASALTSTGETLPAVSGNAEGSIAKDILGYTFDGWYTDEACEQAVGEDDGIVSVVTDPIVGTKFTPRKEAATEQLPGGYYSDAVFYAKYTEQTATITYKAVCKIGENEYTEDAKGGTVDVPNNATPAGAEDSEAVTVVTGNVAGAIAYPKDNYEFLGWFTKDDNGKYVAIEENGDKLEYHPVKGDIWQDATYYALFELDVADLIISKNFDGSVPEAFKDALFPLTVSLPDGPYKVTGSSQVDSLTVNGGSASINIMAGETIVIKDVTIGSKYSVAENEPSYFDVNGEVENAEIANGENKVNLTNTYKHGRLSIAKTVQATENVDVSKAEFTFKVKLTPAVTGNFDYTVNDSTNKSTAKFTDGVAMIQLKDGETATFETLPNGVSYTVEEIGIPSGYALDEATNNSQSGEITMGTPSAATFTNIHQYGDLVISKTVSGEDAPGGKFVFNITLNNGAFTQTYNGVEFKEGKAQVELSVAKNETKTATIIGLPAGTTYTVTEEAVPGYTTTITDAAGIIDAAGTDTVAFVNEYKTGTLTIKKVVTAAKDVTAPEKGFDFIVTLKDPSGNVLTGSYAYTIDNGGTGGSLSSSGTIKLKHDQTATFGKLPDGVTFEVVETADSDYVTSVSLNNGAAATQNSVSGKISAGSTQAVEFANFYNYGNLTITKTVEGAPSDLTKQEVFNVQISGLTDGTYSVARSAQSATETLTVSGGKGTLTIKHGETLVIKNIKDGTKVTVMEIEVPSYFEATPASSSMTIDADATDSSANTVAITNTYKSGSLTITKTVVGVTAPDQEFTFTVDIDGMTLADSFAYTVATANVEGTTSGEIVDGGQLTLKNGQTATISGLPVGVNCTVTEQAIDGNPYTTEVKVNDGNSTTASAATVAIPESGAGAVEFTNTYQYSDLKISKTVVNNTDFTPAVNAFVFTVQLSGASVPTQVTYIIGGASYTATVDAGQFKLTLTNSQTATIKNLPAGTTYTVTEAEVSGYTTTITKNSATITEATGTIVAGAQTVDEVVFTNEYKVGSLEVTKEVVGGDAPKGEKFTFTLTLSDTATTVKCAIGDGTATDFQSGNTFELEKGQKALITGIPAGVEYTVTETENPDYTTKVGETETNTATGTIVAGSSSQVEFTNTYKYSHLTIKKTDMKTNTESAIFTVTCDEKTYTVVVPNNEEIVIGKLPIGKTYTISESGDWTWLYTNTTYQHSNGEAKIIEGGSRVDVTNKGTDKWLHDESGVINNLGNGTKTTID